MGVQCADSASTAGFNRRGSTARRPAAAGATEPTLAGQHPQHQSCSYATQWQQSAAHQHEQASTWGRDAHAHAAVHQLHRRSGARSATP